MASKTNGVSDKTTQESSNGNLQVDISLLASLLSQDTSEEIDDTNISELLRRLDTANGVASGVENRLDELLNNLDGLLGTLESAATTVETTEHMPPKRETVDANFQEESS
jgi:hypothetical protein